MADLINPAPILHRRKETQRRKDNSRLDESRRDPVDALEIFEHIRDLKDPEHPHTLEELNVVTEDLIRVDDANSHVWVTFTPTVSHCTMATLIGLCIRVKLLQDLPSRFKVDVRVTPGTHSSEDATNKQLNDKERVAAALENPNLCAAVNQSLGFYCRDR